MSGFDDDSYADDDLLALFGGLDNDSYGDDGDTPEFDDDHDGQPDEYTEWQDFMGGDDWDHGQYDE